MWGGSGTLSPIKVDNTYTADKAGIFAASTAGLSNDASGYGIVSTTGTILLQLKCITDSWNSAYAGGMITIIKVSKGDTISITDRTYNKGLLVKLI